MKTKTFLIIGFLYICFSSCKDENIQKEYYKTGILKQVAEMKDGKRNGLTKNYDKQGRLVSTAELKDDVYDGWMINYNPANHKVTAKAYFKNDKQNGPVTLYYSDGQLYRESFYKDGQVDSIVKTYWPGKKLQAENYFKNGEASVGLKEYDRKGNPVKQPTIVVEEINQAALLNTVTLKIHLSDRSEKAKFYSGELKEGKYFDPELPLMYDDVDVITVSKTGESNGSANDGVVTQKYYVSKRSTLMKKLSIVAKCRTEYGNTLILHRYYNLAVTN